MIFQAFVQCKSKIYESKAAPALRQSVRSGVQRLRHYTYCSPNHQFPNYWVPIRQGRKAMIIYTHIHMGGCQNYGPFLGTLNIRCRIRKGIQKGTIILTTTHILLRKGGKHLERQARYLLRLIMKIPGGGGVYYIAL